MPSNVCIFEVKTVEYPALSMYEVVVFPMLTILASEGL